MNDVLVIKTATVFKSEDDNFVSLSSPDVNFILSTLINDCPISLAWFDAKV